MDHGFDGFLFACNSGMFSSGLLGCHVKSSCLYGKYLEREIRVYPQLSGFHVSAKF